MKRDIFETHNEKINISFKIIVFNVRVTYLNSVLVIIFTLMLFNSAFG